MHVFAFAFSVLPICIFQTPWMYFDRDQETYVPAEGRAELEMSLSGPDRLFFRRGSIKSAKGFLLGLCLLYVRTPVLSPLAGNLFAGSSLFFELLPARTVGPAGAHSALNIRQ